MPEGPEVHKIAYLLRLKVINIPIKSVFFSFSHLKKWESCLIGKTIKHVEAKGKVLLIWFSNGLILYTHNQLYGLWKIIYLNEQLCKTKRILRIKIHSGDFNILLYSASEIFIYNQLTLKKNKFLMRLGPDCLDNKLTKKHIMDRMISKNFYKKRLSSLLLDQTFISGLGNYLRMEILWHAQLSGLNKVNNLTDETKNRLCKFILKVPYLSYIRYKNIINNKSDNIFKLCVFNREGQNCYRCKNKITKIYLTGRPFYWCSYCQK